MCFSHYWWTPLVPPPLFQPMYQPISLQQTHVIYFSDVQLRFWSTAWDRSRFHRFVKTPVSLLLKQKCMCWWTHLQDVMFFIINVQSVDLITWTTSPVAADSSPLWLSDKQAAPAGRKYDFRGLKVLMSYTFSFLSMPDITMYLSKKRKEN